MRQQRRERGLKPKGRPCKNPERLNVIDQLEEINNIETEMNEIITNDNI